MIAPTCPTAMRILVDYDPDTGSFRWRRRARGWFKDERSYSTWNSRWAGRDALKKRNALGYRLGTVLNIKILAHRAAIAILMGRWPENHVDHINGDPSDNRAANLRPATVAENQRNVGSKGGASIYCGVHRHASGKWQSRCRDASGKRRCLGTYEREADAALAYDRAAKDWHGEFARLNFPMWEPAPVGDPA